MIMMRGGAKGVVKNCVSLVYVREHEMSNITEQFEPMIFCYQEKMWNHLNVIRTSCILEGTSPRHDVYVSVAKAACREVLKSQMPRGG